MTDRARHRADTPMSLGDHLDDLRRRLVFALLGLLPILIASLVIAPTVLGFLVTPATDALRDAGEPSGLLATGPLEPFVAYLKVSLAITITVGFPWIIYQVWRFVAPGLYPREQRFVYVLIPLSAILTASAALFLYYVLLPISLFFLIQFGSNLAQSDPPASQDIAPEVATLLEDTRLPVLDADPPDNALQPGMRWLNTERNELRIYTGDNVRVLRLRSDAVIAQEYRIGEYVSLIFRLAIVFTIAFQLPLVMLLGEWSGLLQHQTLRRLRKPIGFGCTVAGAVLTPQDPWSMILMGGALYLLFELGLLFMRFLTPERVARGLSGRDHQPTDADQEP